MTQSAQTNVSAIADGMLQAQQTACTRRMRSARMLVATFPRNWRSNRAHRGTGRIRAGEILLEARIMSVADVVEAMASHRPYRPGHGIDKALVEIERGSGTAYDPAVAEACLRLFCEKGYVLPT